MRWQTVLWLVIQAASIGLFKYVYQDIGAVCREMLDDESLFGHGRITCARAGAIMTCYTTHPFSVGRYAMCEHDGAVLGHAVFVIACVVHLI
jgi:hypothetical protein